MSIAPPEPKKREPEKPRRTEQHGEAAPERTVEADMLALGARLGAGLPLDPSTNARMALALDADFSDVRIHTEAADAALASELGATAFALGDDVAFSSGAYRPGTPAGDALLAHELAHVRQQRAGAGAGDSALEDSADRAATGAVGRLWLGVRAPADALAGAVTGDRALKLQRCIDPVPASGVTVDLTVTEADQALMDDLEGLEDPVWSSYRSYSDLVSSQAGLAATGTPMGVGTALGSIPTTNAAYKRYADALAAENMTEKELFAKVDAFEAFFERHALNQAYATLAANEKLVQGELERYSGDPNGGGVAALRAALAPHMPELDVALRERGIAAGRSVGKGGRIRPPDWEQHEAAAKKAELGVRNALVGSFPIVADLELDIDYVARVANTKFAQDALLRTARSRISDIQTTRARLVEKPSLVWQFDLAVETARKSLNIADGSIFAQIIEARIRREATDKMFRNLVIAALAIGLGVLSAGTGTVAVLAASAGAGVSIGLAAAHIEEFMVESAAHGTAFDRAQALSSREPSLFWLALDIVLAAVDVGLAVKAFRALQPVAAAVQTGEKTVEDLKSAARAFAKSEPKLAATAEKFADQVAASASKQLERQKLIAAAEKADAAAVAALRAVAKDDQALAGLLRVEAGTRAKLLATFGNQPAILNRLGRLVDSAPQAARAVEQIAAKLPAAQFKTVIAKYMLTRSEQAPNILRALGDVGVTDADFKAIADALATSTASRQVGRRFATLAIEKIADRLPKGAEGIAKFKQVAAGLHPNQSAIIFERWASRTVYGHSTAERFAAETADLTKTYKGMNPQFKGAKIVTDDTARELGRTAIVDYKSYITGKKFDEAAMTQLDNYAEMVRVGVKNSKGEAFTRVEYLFGTKAAAEKNAATITAKLGDKATIYFVDDAGTKVKYVAGAL